MELQLLLSFQAFGPTNSAGLSAWWTPEESGLIPSISTGWGLAQPTLRTLQTSKVRLASPGTWAFSGLTPS